MSVLSFLLSVFRLHTPTSQVWMPSAVAIAAFSYVCGIARPVSIFVISDSVQPTCRANASCVIPSRRRAPRIACPCSFFVFIMIAIHPGTGGHFCATVK